MNLLSPCQLTEISSFITDYIPIFHSLPNCNKHLPILSLSKVVWEKFASLDRQLINCTGIYSVILEKKKYTVRNSFQSEQS